MTTFLCELLVTIIFLLFVNTNTLKNTVRTNFLTKKMPQNLTKSVENDLENEINFTMKTKQMILLRRSYQLRFPTIKFKPRFSSYKAQQQQQQQQQQEEEEEETTTAIMDLSTAPTTEVLVPTTELMENTVVTTEVLPQPNTESNTEMIITTAMIPSTSSVTPSKPPFLPSPTPSYPIMKPSALFPYNLKEKLKNLFFTSNIKTKPKSKGFLSLFEIIKFENTPCMVTMGATRAMDGICYHEFECKSLGGISTERCAEGAGVCCIFLTGCGDTTSQPVAYFESPNYPKPIQEMLICVLIINLRETTEQLRLDFLLFELNRPTFGDCLDDQFLVSGHDMNFKIPTLCGINTGQHIYVHVSDALSRKIYLTISLKTLTGSRSFNMKITQLEQGKGIAPDGCLQYFTEPEGILKSFNYDIEGVVVNNKEATYLNNLNYAMCLKRGKSTCSVSYTMQLDAYVANSGAGEQVQFQIINKDEEENDLVPDGQAGVGIFNCPNDFLGINQVRLCGERFNDGAVIQDFTVNAAVRDVAAGPIVLPFRSDRMYVGRGFRLAYKQELCA